MSQTPFDKNNVPTSEKKIIISCFIFSVCMPLYDIESKKGMQEKNVTEESQTEKISKEKNDSVSVWDSMDSMPIKKFVQIVSEQMEKEDLWSKPQPKPILKNPADAIYSLPLVDANNLPPVTNATIEKEKIFGKMYTTTVENAIKKNNQNEMDYYYSRKLRLQQQEDIKNCDKAISEICERILHTRPVSTNSDKVALKKATEVLKNPENWTRTAVAAGVVGAGTGVITAVICINDFCISHDYHPFDKAYGSVKKFFETNKDIVEIVPISNENNNLVSTAPVAKENNNFYSTTPAANENNNFWQKLFGR